jgi:hypothetical protein
MPEGPTGQHFVPEYWVSWQNPDGVATLDNPGGKNVAFLRFFEPSMAIRSLHVRDPKYLLRKPAEMPNLLELLTPENSPEAVLREMELTNAVKRQELLRQGGVPRTISNEKQ